MSGIIFEIDHNCKSTSNNKYKKEIFEFFSRKNLVDEKKRDCIL
jgi:hypothetical protein